MKKYKEISAVDNVWDFKTNLQKYLQRIWKHHYEELQNEFLK